MEKTKKCLRATLLFLLLAVLALPVTPAFAGRDEITLTVDGVKLNPDLPPVVQNDRVLAPVRCLAAALQAQVSWDPATASVTVVKGHKTIVMSADSQKIYENGEQIFVGVPPRIIQGRFFVPVSAIVSTLDADFEWNGKTRTVTITTPLPPPVPERVSQSPFPALVAFTNAGCLWILDGSRTGAAPGQVTREGRAEILGWSPDGQWLAWLQKAEEDEFSAKPYLWTVRADGTGSFQVDPRPVLGTPAWSPVTNALAYSTTGPGGGYAPDGNLKIATMENGRAAVSALLPDNTGVIDDFVWAPDGRSLVISLPRSHEQPLLIDRITLEGKRSNLHTLEKAEGSEMMYTHSATGFKWSPDGRYLAYHLNMNSASLSADGVGIRVLDLQRPEQPLDLGVGLGYAQWLAWSPDSSRLAFIRGEGREATTNKHLYLADMREGGKITDCGQAGQADTQPLWTEAQPYTLLFCRAAENEWGGGKQSGVLVPGQRIWLRTAGGETRALTTGAADTADYAPLLSPDGKGLFFLRLNRYDRGSLHCLPMDSADSGGEVELIRGLNGGPGYYGNYYPEWLKIYWKN